MTSFYRSLLFSTFLIGSLVFHNSEAFLDDDESENGNKYIDRLLQDMMEENGHEYDPYKLEDNKIGFHKKVAFVNVSGEAKLHNGYITGLKSLHRPDSCSVENKDGKLHVKADLGAGVLDFYYDGTVKFMSFGPTIRVHGELAYMEVYMEFTVDSDTGRHGELKQFNIRELKGMKMSITGLGPMNWAMNYLISGITKLFNGFTKNFMENKVRTHLEKRLPKYQFPVDGGDIIITDEDVTPEPEIDPEPEDETQDPKIDPEPEDETQEPEIDPEPEDETQEPEIDPVEIEEPVKDEV